MRPCWPLPLKLDQLLAAMDRELQSGAVVDGSKALAKQPEQICSGRVKNGDTEQMALALDRDQWGAVWR